MDERLKEWLARPGGLATRLRTLRTQAGLSGKDMADTNGWQQSKVSRIETGDQMAKPEDVRAWAAACGADEDTLASLLAGLDDAKAMSVTFRTRMSGGQAPVQRSYNELVEQCTLIRHLETIWIPGLVQTPGYARRVFTEMRRLHGALDDIEAAVAARMERQRHLADTGRRFEFLLFHPVILTPLPGAAEMRVQLDRLLGLIGLEHIRFGIIPLGRPLPYTPQGPSVQVYVAGDPVVAVEDYAGETWYRDGVPQIGLYQRIIDLLWEEAVEGDEARELIVRAARDLGEAAPSA